MAQRSISFSFAPLCSSLARAPAHVAPLADTRRWWKEMRCWCGAAGAAVLVACPLISPRRQEDGNHFSLEDKNLLTAEQLELLRRIGQPLRTTNVVPLDRPFPGGKRRGAAGVVGSATPSLTSGHSHHGLLPVPKPLRRVEALLLRAARHATRYSRT